MMHLLLVSKYCGRALDCLSSLVAGVCSRGLLLGLSVFPCSRGRSRTTVERGMGLEDGSFQRSWYTAAFVLQVIAAVLFLLFSRVWGRNRFEFGTGFQGRRM